VTCPECSRLTRENAQLKRDLAEAQEAVTVFTNRWLEAVESKKGKGK
jgi:hypothetical protein